MGCQRGNPTFFTHTTLFILDWANVIIYYYVLSVVEAAANSCFTDFIFFLRLITLTLVEAYFI